MTQKKQHTETKMYANKEKAYLTAQYYGFEGILPPEINKNDEASAKTLKKPHLDITRAEAFLPSIENRVAIVRHYLEN